jgi:GxxExxY protein
VRRLFVTRLFGLHRWPNGDSTGDGRGKRSGVKTGNPTEKLHVDGDPLTHRIIGAAIEVHRLLGPGLLESTYEECLCLELSLAGIPFERQLRLPIVYKSVTLLRAYRLDLLINKAVIVEIKTIEKILPLHEAQLLTYLRLSGLERALLFNFNSVPLKAGIRRLNKTNPSPVSPVSEPFPCPADGGPSTRETRTTS